ncbi:MAG: hypothetical protein M1825_002755 [Sarcosagium campestre]|nr:MAG: hypothetical protein M1825_002755 [Sarcosagium campestre]
MSQHEESANFNLELPVREVLRRASNFLADEDLLTYPAFEQKHEELQRYVSALLMGQTLDCAPLYDEVVQMLRIHGQRIKATKYPTVTASAPALPVHCFTPTDARRQKSLAFSTEKTEHPPFTINRTPNQQNFLASFARRDKEVVEAENAAFELALDSPREGRNKNQGGSIKDIAVRRGRRRGLLQTALHVLASNDEQRRGKNWYYNEVLQPVRTVPSPPESKMFIPSPSDQCEPATDPFEYTKKYMRYRKEQNFIADRVCERMVAEAAKAGVTTPLTTSMVRVRPAKKFHMVKHVVNERLSALLDVLHIFERERVAGGKSSDNDPLSLAFLAGLRQGLILQESPKAEAGRGMRPAAAAVEERPKEAPASRRRPFLPEDYRNIKGALAETPYGGIISPVMEDLAVRAGEELLYVKRNHDLLGQARKQFKERQKKFSGRVLRQYEAMGQREPFKTGPSYRSLIEIASPLQPAPKPTTARETDDDYTDLDTETEINTDTVSDPATDSPHAQAQKLLEAKVVEELSLNKPIRQKLDHDEIWSVTLADSRHRRAAVAAATTVTAMNAVTDRNVDPVLVPALGPAAVVQPLALAPKQLPRLPLGKGLSLPPEIRDFSWRDYAVLEPGEQFSGGSVRPLFPFAETNLTQVMMSAEIEADLAGRDVARGRGDGGGAEDTDAAPGTGRGGGGDGGDGGGKNKQKLQAATRVNKFKEALTRRASVFELPEPAQGPEVSGVVEPEDSITVEPPTSEGPSSPGIASTKRRFRNYDDDDDMPEETDPPPRKRMRTTTI